MTLRLDWASREAAVYACRHWHYSRSVPASRLMVLGVWEDTEFKGVVTFSRGATARIGAPYKLTQVEICELTRVALREHVAPVSRIVAIALRMLRKACPGLRLVISYAAGEQGHHGGIYQAGNWIYEGPMDSYGFVIKGEFKHARIMSVRYGSGALAFLQKHVDPDVRKVTGLVRHKYLMPMDDGMRAAVASLSKPYPKAGGPKASDSVSSGQSTGPRLPQA